jgi:hypothetical protein
VRSHGHRPGEPDGIRPGPRLIRSNKLIAGKGTVLMLHSHMCICMCIYIYIFKYVINNYSIMIYIYIIIYI